MQITYLKILKKIFSLNILDISLSPSLYDMNDDNSYMKWMIWSNTCPFVFSTREIRVNPRTLVCDSRTHPNPA